MTEEKLGRNRGEIRGEIRERIYIEVEGERVREIE